MFSHSSVPLRFEFHSSKILAVIFTVVHAAALGALLPLALPLWAKLALASVIACSLAYHMRLDALLLAPASITTLEFKEDILKLTTRDSRQLEAMVSSDSLVTPLLTVLNLQAQGTRSMRRVVILPDSMDAESFRQLRVWLKWQ